MFSLKNSTFVLLSRIQKCRSNYRQILDFPFEFLNLKNIHTSVYLNFKLPDLKFLKPKDEQKTSDDEIELNIPEELRKLKGEVMECFTLHNRFLEFRDQRHTIDLLYTFEKDSDLDKFIVSTDSSNDVGYSSASLKISPIRTGIFSGYLCTEIPKTGDVVQTGFVNMNSLRIFKSFKRLACFDWTDYTHLVLKVRGDGRTYKIMLHTPGEYSHEKYMYYSHPLYTRGGPYWQITKIPFSHFYFVHSGRIVLNQGWVIPLNKVARFGITLSDNNDGPFKLEIDYVGLEAINQCKMISPYENYYVGKNMAR